MKRVFIFLAIVVIVLSGCSQTKAPIPADGNLIPYGGTVSANTVYTDTFYLETNCWFKAQVVYPVDDVTVNGTDIVAFTTSWSNTYSAYKLDISIGDLSPGDVVEVWYCGYEKVYLEVE